jgi:hypothetical protein
VREITVERSEEGKREDVRMAGRVEIARNRVLYSREAITLYFIG